MKKYIFVLCMSRCYTVPHVYTYAIQHDPQISRYTNKVQCELQKQNMYPYSLSLSVSLYILIYTYTFVFRMQLYTLKFMHILKKSIFYILLIPFLP